jgi:hypothetical protein
VLLNPCVTRGSSLVDDFRDSRGSFSCRIHESLVGAVSLMTSELLGDVCAVESMRH